MTSAIPNTAPPVKPTDPFFSILADTNYSADPSGLTAAEAGITSQFGSTTNFDNLLASWDMDNGDPATRKVFPRTYQQFVTAVEQASGSTNATAIMNGFETEFAQILQITGGISGGGGDYTGIPTSQLTTQFQDAFSSFLYNFQFQVDTNADGTPGPTDGAAGPTSYFIQQWHTWMTVTATNLTQYATGPTANVSTFQQIYQAFFPNGTEAQFIALRNQLVQQEINDPNFNYFIPSHFLSQWYTLVQTAYLTPLLGDSSAALTDSDQLTVIWKVFNLCVQVIANLETLSTVASGQLNFLTNYQEAYTNLMAQIPVFTAGDGSPFGGTDSTSAEARQELNPKNQTLTQNLQSYRDLLGDQAQTVQSNLNQLNQSVNQQSSLCDSILQEMNTILSSIFPA
jgi:hypothetical protein